MTESVKERQREKKLIGRWSERGEIRYVTEVSQTVLS